MNARQTRRTSQSKRTAMHLTRAGIAYAVGVAACAYVSFAVTSAQIVRNKLPEQALDLNPFDAIAPAFLVERQMARNYRFLATETAKASLTDALSRQPANARAVRLMGYVQDVSGNKNKAAHTLTLAERLSRRDAGTQLWLLEDAVQRDDVPNVLQHYDRMLRTSNDSRNVLFPILTSALKNGEVRTAFARYIRQPSPWVATYLSYGILEGGDPVSIADAIDVAGGLPNTEQFGTLNTQLLDRLVAVGQFARARQFYLSLPGRRATDLERVDLNDATVNPANSPVAWQPTATGSSGAEIGNSGRSLSMRIFGTSGETVAVARKMLILTPGRYSLTLKIGTVEGDPKSAIGIVVGCKAVGQDTVLLEQRVPLEKSPTVASASFSVPAQCEAEFVTLQAIGGLGEQGFDVELSSFKVAKM